ncbi:MAG: SH3 domain-containing protein [Phycisphaerae bacterium]
MRSSALTLFCIAAVCLPALAQSDATGGQQEYRYVARVKGSNVNIRSRPDIRYGYRCAQISAPQTVRVVRDLDGWVEILPTDDCFSVVSAEYVRRDGNSDIGTITGDRVRIRAAGEDRTQSFNVVQGYLNTGDQVRIIGQLSDHMGRWYKIEPPLGAYWYISADYVERADRGRPSPGPSPVIRQPGTTPQTRPAGSLATAPTTREADDDDDDAQSRAAEEFEAAEEALKEEYQKPLPERDLTALLQRYRSIEAPEESLLKSYIDARVAHIRHTIARQEAYLSAKLLAEQTAERQREYELRLARIQAETPSVEEVTAYDAEGVLMPSEIFTGGANTTRRYTLRDTLSRRINAYVQSGAEELDLSQYVGKKVGVFGRKRYDTSLQLYIIEAERVVVLMDDPRILEPSRPTVIPRARITPARPPEPEPPREIAQPVERPDAPEQQADETPEDAEPDEPETRETAEPQAVEDEQPSDEEPREPDEEPSEPKDIEPEPSEPSGEEPASEQEQPPSTQGDDTAELPETGLEMVTPQTRPNGGDQAVPEEEYD